MEPKVMESTAMEPVGRYLRHEREVRQISLEELSQTTRIPLRTLHSIEADRLDQLPGDVFIKGFLRSYAKAIGLAELDVLRRWTAQQKPAATTPAPLSTIAQPERGRRFGIAIALVILLILFTLAISIVLRPRHRDAPVELSLRAPAALVDGGSTRSA